MIHMIEVYTRGASLEACFIVAELADEKGVKNKTKKGFWPLSAMKGIGKICF